MNSFIETWIPVGTWDEGQQLWVNAQLPALSMEPQIIEPKTTLLEVGHDYVEHNGIWLPEAPETHWTFKYSEILSQMVGNAFAVPPLFTVLHAFPVRRPDDELAELVPALKGWNEPCPACSTDGHCPLSSTIQHLNDHHAWSRERIADWLDTLDVDLTFQPAQTGD